MKLTTEEIIQEFKKVHGDKYDYSKVDYKNATSKVVIICEKHGEFLQIPNKHKSGQGCPACIGKGLSNEEIIEEFKKVHGDKYDYSKVNYIKNNLKVIIICREHGEFSQIPNSHKQGVGCPTCAGKGLSTEEIIEEFKKVHGDKYDYSKVDFKKIQEKVIIICREHGEFLQFSNKHRAGNGCPMCSGKNLSTEDIIREFKKAHGDRYDYSKVEYTSINSKVTIICKEHGDFLQTPDNHKRGKGCPVCAGQDLSTEDIIHHFKQVHGDKYDYSKVDYIKAISKVIIICKEHGEFQQTPAKS